MAINSKVEICSMALSQLGAKGTVTNIDTPTNDKELIFAQWYDITRQALLKQILPNFSLARKFVALSAEVPAFGYAYAYEYPSDCLKVLGGGNLSEKLNNYSIETLPSGKTAIVTDVLWETGFELRYVKDVTDVTRMSPEFKLLMSINLAMNVCLPITQDVSKSNALMKQLLAKSSDVSGQNAQENPPIRISRSRFRASRRFNVPDFSAGKK